MRRAGYIIVLLCALASAASAQATLEMMRLKLRQSDYGRVIELADTLLQHQEQLEKAELIELYEIRGVAQYSLQQLDGALASFAALLTVAPQHTLDPEKRSPKIIRFFDEVRQSLARQREAAAPAVTRIDTLRLIVPVHDKLAGAMRRSLLLPGWGHLYLGRRGSGAALTAVNALLLGSTVWSISNCRNRQHAYLAAAAAPEIADCYQMYNRAYQTRNTLIASYALFWLVSQADLLMLHPPSAGPQAAWIVPAVEWRSGTFLCSCTIQF